MPTNDDDRLYDDSLWWLDGWPDEHKCSHPGCSKRGDFQPVNQTAWYCCNHAAAIGGPAWERKYHGRELPKSLTWDDFKPADVERLTPETRRKLIVWIDATKDDQRS